MQHVDWLEKTRQIIFETFAEHGAEAADGLHETLLVRDGFYCGRRFSLNGLRAVWFAEENVVKFFGRDGEFLLTRNVDDASQDEPQQRRLRAA